MNTKRLSLRLITTEDARFLYELMNTKKWHQFIGDRGIDSVEAARSYIDQRMDADLESKGFINHVMVERETGTAVGTCSLHNREGVDGIDIGYALLHEFEGVGYASEGAEAMITLAFEKHRQPKVSAITISENSSSCRLLEKLGFTYAGLIRLPNSHEEVKRYVLKKKDWDQYLNRR